MTRTCKSSRGRNNASTYCHVILFICASPSLCPAPCPPCVYICATTGLLPQRHVPLQHRATTPPHRHDFDDARKIIGRGGGEGTRGEGWRGELELLPILKKSGGHTWSASTPVSVHQQPLHFSLQQYHHGYYSTAAASNPLQQQLQFLHVQRQQQELFDLEQQQQQFQKQLQQGNSSHSQWIVQEVSTSCASMSCCVVWLVCLVCACVCVCASVCRCVYLVCEGLAPLCGLCGLCVSYARHSESLVCLERERLVFFFHSYASVLLCCLCVSRVSVSYDLCVRVWRRVCECMEVCIS